MNFIDPMPEFDGAELLDRIVAWLARFVLVVEHDHLCLLALWIVHTHLADVLYTTPRLLIDSPVPASGKTTLMEHLQRLCRDPLLAAAITSAALIPRALGTGMRTILIDEVHRTLRPDKPGVDDLLVAINIGYRQGATRAVLTRDGNEWVPREMPTFAPVAMAGNAPDLPDDTISRQLRILLLPDVDGKTEDTDWEILTPETTKLHDDIARWAKSQRDGVKGMTVELPQGCRGRLAEKWKPLKRVAVAAGDRWPAVVDRLAEINIAEHHAERDAGLKTQPTGVVLLTDLYAVWLHGEDFLTTAELLRRLVEHNDSYWGLGSPFHKSLTAKRLGNLVADAANARPTRQPGTGLHGYMRQDFVLAWHRLGVAPLNSPPVPTDAPHPKPEDSHPDGLDASNGSDGSHETAADPTGNNAQRLPLQSNQFGDDSCGKQEPFDVDLRFAELRARYGADGQHHNEDDTQDDSVAAPTRTAAPRTRAAHYDPPSKKRRGSRRKGRR